MCFKIISLGGFFSSRISPVYIACRLLMLAGWVFNFLLSFWLALLQLWEMLSIFFEKRFWVCLFFIFFFFLLKGVGTIYLWRLASETLALFWIYFAGAGHRTFLEGSCHWNPRPCELRCVCARKGDQVVVTQNVHKAEALFMSTFDS